MILFIRILLSDGLVKLILDGQDRDQVLRLECLMMASKVFTVAEKMETMSKAGLMVLELAMLK